MELQKKKQELQVQLQQKVQNLQNLENLRNQLIGEINQLQGKIQLLEELENDDKKQSKDKDSQARGETERN